MTSDEKEAEALLDQSKGQKRHTTDPTKETEPDTPDRTEAIKSALLAVEDGETPENINIRDARLKALLVGLEDAGELSAVALSVGETLDRDLDDGDDTTQSEVARLLMRVGLQEAAPEVLADATEARQQAALEQANDF